MDKKNSLPLHSLLNTKLVFPTKGEMVEWSITTVLKTVVLRGTGGSNPSLSAKAPNGGIQTRSQKAYKAP